MRDNKRNRKSNKNHRDNREKGPEVHTRGEQIELIFVEKDFRGERRKVAVLGEGTYIDPDYRFDPVIGETYQCSVMGKRAAPTLTAGLPSEVWMPESELRKPIKVSLTFRPGRDSKGFIAFYRGYPVFPDRGSEVSVDRSRGYLLSYGGNKFFANALPETASEGSGLTASIGESVGHEVAKDPSLVTMKCAKSRPGLVGTPKHEDDTVVTETEKSIWQLLRLAPTDRIGKIRSVSKIKIEGTEPERVLKAFGGPEKAPVVIRMNAQFNHDAFCEAAERAIQIAEGRGKSAENTTSDGTAEPEAKTEPTAGKPEKTGTEAKPKRTSSRKKAKTAGSSDGETEGYPNLSEEFAERQKGVTVEVLPQKATVDNHEPEPKCGADDDASESEDGSRSGMDRFRSKWNAAGTATKPATEPKADNANGTDEGKEATPNGSFAEQLAAVDLTPKD